MRAQRELPHVVGGPARAQVGADDAPRAGADHELGFVGLDPGDLGEGMQHPAVIGEAHGAPRSQHQPDAPRRRRV